VFDKDPIRRAQALSDGFQTPPRGFDQPTLQAYCQRRLNESKKEMSQDRFDAASLALDNWRTREPVDIGLPRHGHIL